MNALAAEWFEERGGLHDARVRAAHLDGTTLRITVADEWANEHDDPDENCPGTLVFDGAAVLEGDVSSLEGGWISEVQYRSGNLVVDLCDRDRLIVRATIATWEPEVR